MIMETALRFHIRKGYIYILIIILFMVSWWGRYSYLIYEPIQIRDFVPVNAAYVSSGSFLSRVRPKYILYYTYKVRRSHLHLKPTPIHGPVNQSE